MYFRCKDPSKIECLPTKVMPSQEMDRANNFEETHYGDVNEQSSDEIDNE